MSREMDAAEIQSFFIQRCRHDGMDFLFHGEAACLLDIFIGGLAGSAIDFGKRQIRRQVVEVDHIDGPALILAVSRILDRMAAEICTDDLHGPFHDLQITENHGTGNIINL